MEGITYITLTGEEVRSIVVKDVERRVRDKEAVPLNWGITKSTWRNGHSLEIRLEPAASLDLG